MPLGWINAYKRALIYFLWLIVWNIIGMLMIGIGVFVAIIPLTSLLSGKTPTVGTELLTGIVLVVLGYLITMLGTIATFIRLVYQLSYEATQEVLTKGKTAGATPGPAALMSEARPTPSPVTHQVQPASQQVSPVIPRQPMAPAPTSGQKYCAFCGKPIAVSARFCPFCQRAQP